MTLSQRLPIWLLSGLLAIGSVACSGTETETTDDASDVSDATDAADASDASDASDPSTTSSDCTENGFTVGNQTAAAATDNYWSLVAASTDGTAIIRVESYISGNYDGPTTTGSYPLGGNYSTCALCVLVSSGCQDGANCSKTFYADEGTLDITALSLDVNGSVQVELKDVLLTEVTIAEGTFESTPVPNGSTWCIPSTTASGTFTDPDAPDTSGATAPEAPELTCVAGGNGQGVGANLKDFTMTNCNGEEINMHSLACSENVDAVWFIASADWCGPCHAYADTAKERLDNANQAGIALVEVIGEDLNGNAATIETCRKYADEHSLDYSHVFFDAKWQTLFANVWAYPIGQGTMYFPWVGVAKGSNLEYVYSSQFNAADYPADSPNLGGYNGMSILNELAGVPGADDGDTTGTDGTEGDAN
jgi:hypothetical protein